MSKKRLRPRVQAKKTAKELADNYVIKYSDDGETFQIYLKGDEKSGPISSGSLLGEDERRIFNRKKKLTTRYFEDLASAKADEKKDDGNAGNPEDKSKYEKEIDNLKKKLAQQEKDFNTKLKLIEKKTKKGDIVDDTEDAVDDKENKIENKYLVDQVFTGNYKGTELPFGQFKSKDNYNIVGLPSDDEILDVKNTDYWKTIASNPLRILDIADNIPDWDYFKYAKEQGKKYLVYYNDVYNVDENLKKLENGEIEKPVVDQNYIVINKRSNEMNVGDRPVLRQGNTGDKNVFDNVKIVKKPQPDFANGDAGVPIGALFGLSYNTSGENIAHGRENSPFEAIGSYIASSNIIRNLLGGIKLWNFANKRGLPEYKQQKALPQGFGRSYNHEIVPESTLKAYAPAFKHGGKLTSR